MPQGIFMAKNVANRSWRPLLFSFLLLLAAPLAVISDPVPSPRRLSVFARVNNKLYIQGGFNTTTYTGQLMSLDLSLNWPSSAPAWDMTLPDGIVTSRHGMAAVDPKFSAGLGNSTQGYLLLVGSSNNITAAFWNAYDIQQKKWSSVTVTPKAPLTATDTYPHLQGQSVVTDPGTGLVYVVGGFWNTSYNRLMIMDPSTRTLLHFETVANTSSLSSESAVWSTARNTILVFGGSLAAPIASAGISLATVQEYNPATAVWSSLATTGDVPAGRMDQCVAASDDGTKMILFGGSNGGTTFFNSLYIFDVVNAKWTQGSPGSNFRTRMACTYSQNQFIAWGGSSADDRSTMLDSAPVVYDVQYDKWTNAYSSTPPTAPPPNPSTGGNGTGTGSVGGGSKSSGAAIGGAVGGVVVVLIAGVAGFLFYRKKKTRAQKAFNDDARVAASLAADGDSSYRQTKGGPSDGDYSPSSAHPGEGKTFYQNKKSSPSNDYLVASRQRRQQHQQQYQQHLQQQEEQQQRPFDQFAAASGQQHQWVINTATTPKADAITMAGLLSESRPYTGYTEAYSEDGEQLSLVPPSSNWSNVSGSRPHSGTGLLSNDERSAAVQNNSNAFVIHHPLQKQGSSNPLPPNIPETPPFQSALTAAAAGLASAISANGSNHSGATSSAGHSAAIRTQANLTAPIPIPGPTGANSTTMSLGTGPSQGISPPISPTGTTYLPNQQAHQQLPRQLYASSAGNRSISSEIAYHQPVQFQQLGNYNPTPYRPGPSKPGSANTSAAISVPGVNTGNPYQQNVQPSRPYATADTTASDSSDDLQRLHQALVSYQQQQQHQQLQQQQYHHQQQQQQQQGGARPRSPSALLKDTDEMYGASPNLTALRDSKSPQVYYPDILAYYAATAPSTPALANKTYDGLDAKQQELLQQLYQDHQQQLQQLLRKQQLQQQEQELQLQIHQQQQLLLQQQQQNRNYMPPEAAAQVYNAQKDAQMAPSRSEGYRSPSPSRGPHLYVSGTPTDYVAPPRRH